MVETMNETGNVERRAKRYNDLTPQEKWQIFLETSAKDAPEGEILRRQAEAGALKE